MSMLRNKPGFADAIVGLQWGDEGKAKIVDVLSERYDYTVRFQGGANAGHTVIHNGQKMVFHLIPSSVFHEETKSVIGNGVIFDPEIFFKEIESLNKLGLDVSSRVVISDKAVLSLPIHKTMDIERDKRLHIETTKQGIGPAYESKMARCALKIFDIYTGKYKEKVVDLLYFFGFERNSPEFDENIRYIETYQDKLKPFIDKTELLLNAEIFNGKTVLFEGAQGCGLDIDFGTYPFVTSSNTIPAASFTGSGLSFRHIRDIYGLFKVYTTRVGAGPFPTELQNELGAQLREKGKEYGATTGRPRNCGWLDLVQVAYYALISGVSKLIMTKIDIFFDLPSFKVCVAYKDNKTGEEVGFFPVNDLDSYTPVYKEFHGFDSENSPYFKEFMRFVEDFINVPIFMVSTGSGNEAFKLYAV